MLRILHVSAGAERGGLEAILLNIVRCLDRSRFTPEVAFLMDGPFVHEVREAGVETHVVGAGRVREFVRGARAIVALARLIQTQAIDIVHTHNSKAHIYGGLAAAVTGVPSVLHLHGVPVPSFRRDGFVSLLSVLVPARRTIACANWVAEAFDTVWRSRRKILVIHGGVIADVKEGGSGSATVRQEFGLPTGGPLVVMATRLQHSKGVHVFLESAARIVEECPETKFMVVGGSLFGLEPGYAEELRCQADRLRLGQSLIFTGYRPDVSRFLSAADIVVHCSIEPDAFPTVILEAMSWGKVVVASDSGGPREIVEPQVTGLLVPSNDSKALATAILALLADRERRVCMGQAGAARVRERFSAGRMVAELEALYEEICSVAHVAA